jgi:hypothetical protein
MLPAMSAAAQSKTPGGGGKSLDDALSLLAQGFLRGGLASFLKAATSGSSLSPEVRVGVSQAYVAFFSWLGPAWTERHLAALLAHVLELASGSAARSAATHTELVYTRNCVAFVLASLLGRQLREKAQLAACKELTAAVGRSLNSSGEQLPGSGGENIQESLQQHVQVKNLYQHTVLTVSLVRNVLSRIRKNFIPNSDSGFRFWILHKKREQYRYLYHV